MNDSQENRNPDSAPEPETAARIMYRRLYAAHERIKRLESRARWRDLLVALSGFAAGASLASLLP